MKVPDNTYFGEKPEGGGITYGEIRNIHDDKRKIEILKLRIDTLLIKQIDDLSKKNSSDNYSVWSPFPLAILTFIAIETLGRIISNLKKIRIKNENEESKAIVTPIYKLMDIKLSHGVTIKFHKAFEVLHGKSDKKSLNVYSDVIHKYQRNTFNHGYQAKEFPWKIEEDKGYMILNPYLFWELYKKTYDRVFESILNNKNKEWRKNATHYLNNLLN